MAEVQDWHNLPKKAFTAEDYGRAFQRLRPGLLEAALDLALRRIGGFYGDPDKDENGRIEFETLYHDLIGAAELVRVFLIADRPDIYGRYGVADYDDWPGTGRPWTVAEVADPPQPG